MVNVNLGTDSREYEILTDAAHNIPAVLTPDDAYLAIEIGVREGGSSQMVMQIIAQRGLNGLVPFVAVDRYGGLAQQHSDTQSMVLDYTNSMRNVAMGSLYQIAEHLNINFLFYNMDDEDFGDIFEQCGIPVFQNGQKFWYHSIGFVHFDGPHHWQMVLKEVEMFEPYAIPGAVFVFDDINLFDTAPAFKYLEDHGWELLKKGNHKASYKKKTV